MQIPNLSDAPLGQIDQSIVQKKNQAYNEWLLHNLGFQQEADLDTRFYVGSQDLLYDLYGNLPAARRKRFNFNLSKSYIDTESGYQRRSRKSSIVTPIENGSQQTADQFSKLFMWLCNRECVLETISDAFEMACITGMSFLETYIDWRSDPVNGDIKVEALPYNAFIIDPFFRNADLSDCNGMIRRKYLTKAEIVSLMPNSIDIISSVQGSVYPARDGKFQYMPENFNYSASDRVAFDEYYYRAYRQQEMLCDNETGETMEWSGNDDQLKQYLSTYQQVDLIKQMIPTVNQALFVEDRCVYNGPNPLGIDEYPMTPVFYCYRPELPYFNIRVSGLQRILRDVQYLYTRRKIIELDMLESQVTTGYIYKPSSMVNPDDVYEQQGQGKGLALLAKAQMTDIVKIPPPALPPLEMSQSLEAMFPKISGISDVMMGKEANAQTSGYLEQLRMGAGLTTQQGVFDHLDRAQKIMGRIWLKIMQLNWTPGKIKRIINQEPTKEFYNKNFGKYDCAVEEGLNTSTQRQLTFATLMQLREILGDLIPADVIIENITLPNKDELKKSIQQAQQSQQQMQQQQQQIQMQQVQAELQLSQARAKADTGLFYERTSRVQENIAAAEQRKHEAIKDDDVALLNLIKAIKELKTMDLDHESMDISHIRELLTMANDLKMQEQTLINPPQLAEPMQQQEQPQMQAQVQAPAQQSMMPPQAAMNPSAMENLQGMQ
jgi:hypothetical protein